MEQKIIPNPEVPAAPLLPPNDAAPFGDDFFTGAKSPVEDPSVLTASKAVLSASVGHATIGDPVTDQVDLPVPVVVDGQVTRAAQVRELTGRDEEALARAAVGDAPERMLDVLLERGVVAIGGRKPTAPELSALPVGDRDALILAIRKITYGSEVRFDKITCSKCSQDIELTYDLDDVPVVRREDVSVDVVVPLRRGGQARLRMISGDDQRAVLAAVRERKATTRAEQDTVLLGRVLVELTDARGQQIPLRGEETARDLPSADRSAMIRALEDHRAGPRMDEATVTCPWCGRETEVPLSIDLLFRG